MRIQPLSLMLLGVSASVLSAPAPAADSAAIARGKAVYQYWCATCHGATGAMPRPLPGTGALQLKYQGQKPAVLEEWTDLDAGLVRIIVRQGIKAMPFFRKTEVSDADLEAIAAYLTRNNR